MKCYSVSGGSNSTVTVKPWIFKALKDAKKFARDFIANHQGEGNVWCGVWLDNDGVASEENTYFVRGK